MRATGLTARFEQERPQLKAVAYRMLGTLADAEDAVQEAWIRLNRTDADELDNLGAWLTTVVARICLNMLRARHARQDEGLVAQMPDPIVDPTLALDIGRSLVIPSTRVLTDVILSDARRSLS